MSKDKTVSTAVDEDASHRLDNAQAGAVTQYGDVGVFFDSPDVRRGDHKNQGVLTIYPGDIINVKLPERNWKFYLHYERKDNLTSMGMFLQKRKQGYRPAMSLDGFESEVFSVDEAGYLRFGPLLVLVADEEVFGRELAARNVAATEIVTASREGFHSEVAKTGSLGSAEAVGAEEVTTDDYHTVVAAR